MVSVTVKRGERHAFYRSTSVFLLASRSFASPILHSPAPVVVPVVGHFTPHSIHSSGANEVSGGWVDERSGKGK